MAKKAVVVEEDENGNVRPKKKRSKCCTCCIVFLIVVLVILGAAFGVGWYFGDKYSQEYLEMPLSDVMSVFNGLYWTDDGDVVTNPYGQEDLDKFYGEVKTNILLKSDAEVDFDGALKDAVSEYVKSDAQKRAAARNAEGDGTTDGTTSGEESSFMDIFVGMAQNVFTRENIDTEKLNAYSEENDNYIFNLNDRQLAAFVNTVLNITLDSDVASIPELKDISDVVNLSDVVALKQIRFGTVSEKDELGVDKISATTADVTVWVGLQSIAGSYLKQMLNENGFEWASGLVGWLGDCLLPENLYATLSFPLNGEAESNITLNDMDSDKRELTYKLVNGILKSTGDGNTTMQSLLSSITDQIKPYIEAAADKIDFSSASTGTIKLDLLGAMAGMTGGENGEQALTKPEFMYMLQALLGSDPEARLTELRPHLYEGWYTDGTNTVYDPESTDGLTKIDYEQILIAEMEEKYALDLPVNAETGKKSISDMLAVLGVSLDGSANSVDKNEIINRLDSGRFRALLDVADVETLKLKVTDRMLGAVLASGMEDIATVEGLSYKLDAFTFVTKPDKPSHKYALIAAELDVASMLGSMDGEGLLGALAAKILPERMILSVTVDITNGEARDPASYQFNDYSNTAQVISTLARLVPSLDLDSISEQLSSKVGEMLDKLNDTLGIEPVAYNSSSAESAGLILPDIFTVITDVAFKDDNGEKPVTAREFKDILGGLYETGDLETRNNVGADPSYSGFITNIVRDYYLNEKYEDPNASITTFDELTTFVSSLGDSFDGKKFLVSGDDATKIYLAYDNRSASELKPIMTGPQLGALMIEQMGEDLNGFTVRDVQTLENKLRVTVSVDIDGLLPETVKKLLDDVTTLYVTADVDLQRTNATGDGYLVEIQINEMSDDTHAALIRLARRYDSGFDVDGSVDEFGRILYDKIGELERSMGDGILTFTERGMELAGFYDFLAKKMNMSGEYTAEDLKTAVQGMYEKSTVPELVNSKNFTKYFVERNPGATSFDSMFLLTGGTKTDVEFNGFFYDIGDSMAGGKNSGIHSVQTVILAESDLRKDSVGAGANSSPMAIRKWIKAHTEDVGKPADEIADGEVTGEELLVVTFEISMNTFGSSASADGFLPDFVYATAVFTRESGSNRFNETADIIFNDMTKAQFDMLSNMMGIDAPDQDGTVNITTVCKRAAQLLNAAISSGDVALAVNDTGSIGIGKIVYTKS